MHLFLSAIFSYKAPLLDDEVYYYLWSKKPDFGYPEHGPFLPWIYALISPLLGESALAIRFFGLIGMQFVSVAVFFIHEEPIWNQDSMDCIFNLPVITCDFHDVDCFND